MFRAPLCPSSRVQFYTLLHMIFSIGPMDKTMTLIKLLNNTSLLTPYEQSFIHSLDKEGELISEQNTGESNPILQLAIDPSNPPRDQSSRKTASTQCTRPATQRPKTPAST